MKILLSPSKMISPCKKDKEMSEPLFLRETNHLIAFLLKHFSLKDYQKGLKISLPLATRDYARLSHFYQLEEYPAFFSFSGTLYKTIDPFSLTPEELKYAEEHLLIFDAIYGLLRIRDAMRYHRMDMGFRQKDFSLLHYWKNLLSFYLKDEFLLNFASQEYAPLLKDHKEKITFIFVYEQKDKIYSFSSSNIKWIRGKYILYIIKNAITNPLELKNISLHKFKFSLKYSTENTYVYLHDKTTKLF